VARDSGETAAVDARQRALDLTVLVVVAFPAIMMAIAVALAVRLSSVGPILYRQTRVGRDEQPFCLLKFRSMRQGPNPLVPDTASITPVGRVLRKFSVDELPQLMNVLRGEMSIVGPRPMLEFQAERCDERQRGRFGVRPGLTGLAQVRGRNELSWPDRIELDLEYVASRSTWLDVSIIAKTPASLLSGAGIEGHQADDPFVHGGTSDA